MGGEPNQRQLSTHPYKSYVYCMTIIPKKGIQGLQNRKGKKKISSPTLILAVAASVKYGYVILFHIIVIAMEMK